jgi:hypothetical protein
MKRMSLTVLIALASTVSGVLTTCLADQGDRDSTSLESDSAVARIVDYHMPVSLTGTSDGVITLGRNVWIGDTIEVSERGSCTLLFLDGTVREYGGPASVQFRTPAESERCKVLNKIAHSIVQLLFASERLVDDAHLGTRDLLLDDPIDRVPRLVYPPDRTEFLDAPDYFKWRFVEGVTEYSVALYEGSKVLLNVNTSDTSLKINKDLQTLKPGVRYEWRVEAIIRDSCLRSKPSTFQIVDPDRRNEILHKIAQITDGTADKRLARLLVAQIYGESGLRVSCYWELESILEDYPNDSAVLRAKADVLYEMGRVEEALLTYRAILNSD